MNCERENANSGRLLAVAVVAIVLVSSFVALSAVMSEEISAAPDIDHHPDENFMFEDSGYTVGEVMELGLHAKKIDYKWQRPEVSLNFTIRDSGTYGEVFPLSVQIDGVWHEIAELRLIEDDGRYMLQIRAGSDPVMDTLNIGGYGWASQAYLTESWSNVNQIYSDPDELVWMSIPPNVWYENLSVNVPESSILDVSYEYSTKLATILNVDQGSSKPMVTLIFKDYSVLSDECLEEGESEVDISGLEERLSIPEGYVISGWAYLYQSAIPDIELGGTAYVPYGKIIYVFPVFQEANTLVTFKSMGETILTQSIVEGGTVLPPEDPELYGYTFKGWYADEGFTTPFDFSEPIYADTTVYAKWEGDLHFTSDPSAAMNVTSLANGTYLFDATPSEDYSTVLWDFGDGTTSTETYVEHHFSEPGTYTVTLTVYNDIGSSTTTYEVDTTDDGTTGGGEMTLLGSSTPSSHWSSSSSWQLSCVGRSDTDTSTGVSA